MTVAPTGPKSNPALVADGADLTETFARLPAPEHAEPTAEAESDGDATSDNRPRARTAGEHPADTETPPTRRQRGPGTPYSARTARFPPIRRTPVPFGTGVRTLHIW